MKPISIFFMMLVITLIIALIYLHKSKEPKSNIFAEQVCAKRNTCVGGNK